VSGDSNRLSILLLLFMKVILMFVVDTKYYKQYPDTLNNDNGCPQFPDVTVKELCVFLTKIRQAGHNIRDIMKDC
jgi:hypothetical protein